MSHSYQKSLYKELFNDSVENDDIFYKSIFTTPVYDDLLLGVLRENSEAIVLSSDISERNLAILRKIFTAGLTVLKDAIQYDERDDIADISTNCLMVNSQCHLKLYLIMAVVISLN